MALVVGNKAIQSIIPQYDQAGVLTGVLVRVNRAIVDDSTVPPRVIHGLPTSREVDIWPQLTPAQRTTATTFFNRMAALMSSITEFDR